MPRPDPAAVLTPIQIEVLRIFGVLPDSREFYLSGASALSAFYLGHRRSRDLDLFTPADPLIEATGKALEDSLASAGSACQVVRRFRTFVELVVSRGGESTRVELVRDSPFRLDPTPEAYENVRIDSFRDLAANKLLAAFGRAEPRDLIDVYVLLRDGHCRFEELARWAREKDPGLDAYYLALALRTAADLPERADRLPVEMTTPLDLTDLKRVLSGLAVTLLERGLP